MSPDPARGEDLFDSLAFPEPREAPSRQWAPRAGAVLAVALAALAFWFARTAVESAGLAAWHLPTLVRALGTAAVLATGAALLRSRPLDAALAAWLLAVALTGLELTVGALPLTAAACVVLGTAPWRRP